METTNNYAKQVRDLISPKNRSEKDKKEGSKGEYESANALDMYASWAHILKGKDFFKEADINEAELIRTNVSGLIKGGYLDAKGRRSAQSVLSVAHQVISNGVGQNRIRKGSDKWEKLKSQIGSVPTYQPGKGWRKIKLGFVPAILLLAVTGVFALKSSLVVAELLGLAELGTILFLGFLGSEFIVLAWIFEPPSGKYNKAQMRALDFGKWYILGAGFVEGILLLATLRMGAEVPFFLVMAQAGIGLSVVVVAAGCSFGLIHYDTERRIKVERNDTFLVTQMENAKLELQINRSQIAAKQMELASLNKIRKDIKNYTIQALNSSEAQTELAKLGNTLAVGLITKTGLLIEETIKGELGK